MHQYWTSAREVHRVYGQHDVDAQVAQGDNVVGASTLPS